MGEFGRIVNCVCNLLLLSSSFSSSSWFWVFPYLQNNFLFGSIRFPFVPSELFSDIPKYTLIGQNNTLSSLLPSNIKMLRRYVCVYVRYYNHHIPPTSGPPINRYHRFILTLWCSHAGWPKFYFALIRKTYQINCCHAIGACSIIHSILHGSFHSS